MILLSIKAKYLFSSIYSKHSQSAGLVFSAKLEVATKPGIPILTSDLVTWTDKKEIGI